jgi:hypothetical protein
MEVHFIGFTIDKDTIRVSVEAEIFWGNDTTGKDTGCNDHGRFAGFGDTDTRLIISIRFVAGITRVATFIPDTVGPLLGRFSIDTWITIVIICSVAAITEDTISD